MRDRSIALPVVALCTIALVGAISARAQAFPEKLSSHGTFDFDYGSAVSSAGGDGTAYKPESKLFYTGGRGGERVRWWAVLGTWGSSPDAGVWVWELVHHAWDAEVRLPGADPWAKADVLYSGGTAYVSLRDDRDSTSGNPRASTLYSLRYRGDGEWGRVSGPTTITTERAETLTIARDGPGRLWATYEANGKIWIGSTPRGGTTFRFTALSRSNVEGDDISAVTAFGGDRIGVFWSDQHDRRDMFAWRRDTDPVSADWHVQTAYGGGVGGCPSSSPCADDHMNVKVYRGEIFVAVKTSLNDASSSAPGDPLIVLLHRDDRGRWSASKVSTVGQDATRPIVILDPGSARIWVWATRGDEVDVWQSPFGAPSFRSDRYTTWVAGVGANDATSTKQPTTRASGVVVEVSAVGDHEFWHNEFMRSP